MTLRVNNTGKLFGAIVGAWAGGKLLRSLLEYERTGSEPGPTPPKGASGDSSLQAALDGTLSRSVQEELTIAAIGGDGRKFTSLLDSHGCPANPKLRSRLWAHFGGD